MRDEPYGASGRTGNRNGLEPAGVGAGCCSPRHPRAPPVPSAPSRGGADSARGGNPRPGDTGEAPTHGGLFPAAALAEYRAARVVWFKLHASTLKKQRSSAGTAHFQSSLPCHMFRREGRKCALGRMLSAEGGGGLGDEVQGNSMLGKH